MKLTTNTLLKLFALTACLLGAASARSATVQVTANISGHETWHTTNEYVLNGFIYVLDGMQDRDHGRLLGAMAVAASQL